MFDTGSTGFMIVCAMLVLLMTPGLAFFYGGLSRRKNVVKDAVCRGQDPLELGLAARRRAEQKGLEGDDARLREFVDAGDMLRSGAAVEAEVDKRSAGGDVDAIFEDRGGILGRRGDGHFENGRDAARGGGGRFGREAAPFGAGGFAKMNVRIDAAGKEQRASRVHPLRRPREPGAVAENRDPAVPDPDGALKNAFGNGDPRIPDQEIEDRRHGRYAPSGGACVRSTRVRISSAAFRTFFTRTSSVSPVARLSGSVTPTLPQECSNGK